MQLTPISSETSLASEPLATAEESLRLAQQIRKNLWLYRDAHAVVYVGCLPLFLLSLAAGASPRVDTGFEIVIRAKDKIE